MQIMLDTTVYEEPHVLRALAAFLIVVAGGETAAASTESPINGKGEPIELKAEPDFKPEDSLPADTFETTGKAAPPMIPPPPLDVLAAQHTAETLTRLAGDTLPPMIPPPPGLAAGPEFDSKGVQWSAALHTSTKARTIDGQWKLRRSRTAQVPAGTTAPVTTLPPMPPPQHTLKIQGVPVPPGTEAAAIAAYAGSQTGAPPIPPPPVIPPAAADDDAELEADEAPAASAMDFPTFITKITAGMNAGTVTQARITEVMGQFKLDSLFSLNTKPELVDGVAKAFGF